MNPSFASDLATRLTADYEFREQQGFLRKGRCPQCERRELYTKASAPWWVRCGRLNKCGWEAHIKELYPNAFVEFNRRFAPTEQNPTATADAYLQMVRGFENERIRGWYEQGRFWHSHGDHGTATIRFWIDRESGVYMERFVEEVTITDPETAERKVRKAHFQGSHRGLWWAPPDMDIVEGDDIWLVEGCLDAIALHHHEVKAVAVLSCVNYPERMLEAMGSRRVRWIWALDNDAAGRKWTRKHLERMRAEGLECMAAQASADEFGKKRDWNDLHLRQALGKDDLERYRYYGDLFAAQVPSEKALRMYEWSERQSFPFEFRKRLFYFKLDLNKYNKALIDLEEQGAKSLSGNQVRLEALRQSGAVQEIANCFPRALYYMANRTTDESWYFFRVFFPHGAAPVNNTFSGGQLASASEFKKRLLAVAAGALFTGTSPQLDVFLRQQIHGLKMIETIDFIGYSRDHRAYIYTDLCVCNGKIYEANEEDYFDTPRLAIRSLNQSVSLDIRNADQFLQEWIGDLWTAFGAKGIAALAFWLGTLFAEQIRDTQKSFPFLEIVGDAGAGKTTLIEFLWKLFGRRDYEGFDPSKSTLAGRARNFAQVANLPVVLIEADRDEDVAHARRFDWEEMKTAYNGRSVRSRGIRNAGNETYEPPFRGAVVISQNAQVNASEAILSRIVHLHFTRREHDDRTRSAAAALEQIPMERISGFLVQAIRRERRLLEIMERKRQEMEPVLFAMESVNSPRIAKNHAQMLGFLHALADVVELPPEAMRDTEVFLEEAAGERQRAINADHPIVEQFWELYDYLDGDKDLNHSMNGRIAVNLNHMAEMAEKRRLSLPAVSDLKRHLRSSKRPKFIDYRAVKSDLFRDKDAFGVDGNGKTIKCWVFERK